MFDIYMGLYTYTYFISHRRLSCRNTVGPGNLHTVGMFRYGTVATHSKGIACAIYIKEEQMRTLAQNQIAYAYREFGVLHIKKYFV